MATPFIADLEEIVYPSASGVHDDRYRIDARRVLAGMFVAELDRPWADTPLPQGGLLVTNDDEIAAIRRQCSHVMVDPKRSTAGMLDAIKAAAVLSNDQSLTLAGYDGGGESPSAPAKSGARDAASVRRRRNAALRDAPEVPEQRVERRDDVHPSNESRVRVRALLMGRDGRPAGPARSAPVSPVARLRSWLAGDARAADESVRIGARRSIEELRAAWGETIGAIEPAGHEPIRGSLADARPAFAQLVAVADSIVAQVRHGNTPALESIRAAIDAFVPVLERAPDAMRWVGAIHAQNAPTPNPAVAVALKLAEFGRSLGMNRESLHELVLIGLLLDVGKALLPRELLEHPGVLAPHDHALVKQHVTIGLDLLSRSGSLPGGVVRAISEHHERLDGSGYPRKLRGDEIGLYGRMAGIVDTFCGLTAIRAYANPLSVEDALSALHGWSGQLFCADLVEHFVLCTGVFPIGTLVELRGGEVAAVVERQPGEQMHPRLVVMTGADKGPLRPVRDRAGEQDPDHVYTGASVRIARGLPAGAYGLRLPDFYARPVQRPGF